jgi:hypothetical protein
LPPVRLEDKERDVLVKEFENLERVSNKFLPDRSEDGSESDNADVRPSIRGTLRHKHAPTEYNKNATPSREKHLKSAEGKIVKNNKSFWSSGIEKGDRDIKIPRDDKSPGRMNRIKGFDHY